MPATVHGDVQTDSSDGRKFITLKLGSKDRPVYRKLYLRTRDTLTARRRARAIEHVTDIAKAREIVAYLAASVSPQEEKRRLAEVSGHQPVIPALSHEFARLELESIVCDFGDHVPGQIPEHIVDDWRLAFSAEEQRRILLSLGVPDGFLRENPSVFTDLASRGLTINPSFKPRYKAMAALFHRPPDTFKPDGHARGPRLSACTAEFRTEQQQRGNQPRHTETYVKRFEEFVQLLHDKPISALAKEDFVQFVDHVMKTCAGKSNKAVRDRLSPVKAVIESARARMPDEVFPEALDNWLKVIDREKRRLPYRPPMLNREPMPPDVFKKLLAQADAWAELDVAAYARSLPVPRDADRRRRALAINRNRRHAQHLKRTGLMTHSVLCLAANVGALPIDMTRLVWSELTLDADMPLYRESREKPAHLLGSEIPRCCPLLPETVRSLKRWREWQRNESAERAGRPMKRRALSAASVDASGSRSAPIAPVAHASPGVTARAPSRVVTDAALVDYVFTYSDGRPVDQQKSNQITDYYAVLRDALDVTWPLRSCRNIGSTIRRDAHLPEDMANAWLGHSARQTNRFYTGEAPIDYLLPLVRAIGVRYADAFRQPHENPLSSKEVRHLGEVVHAAMRRTVAECFRNAAGPLMDDIRALSRPLPEHRS